MSDKEILQSDTGAGIDLLAFEREIEKEIDSLFIPAVQKASGEQTDAKATGRSESDPGLAGGSADKQGLPTDLEDLQVKIEKEIDSLFVPAVEKADGAQADAKVISGSAPDPGLAGGSTDKQGLPTDLEDLQVKVEKEIDSLFVPAVQKAEGEEADAKVSSCSALDPALSCRTTDKHGLPTDLEDLQVKIEREIDFQFVPAVQKADGEQMDAKVLGRSASDPGIVGSSTDKQGLPIDLKDLQVKIENEIDSLFVPAVSSDRSDGAVQTGKRQRVDGTAGGYAAPDVQSLAPTGMQGTSLSKPSGEPTDGGYCEQAQSQESGAWEYQRSEPAGLVESFNAAYLSLDWEYSKENLLKFVAALRPLEPFASKSQDAKYIFRIMDAILKRLATRPRAVNSSLVQLLRESQGLLAHIILAGGQTGHREKKRLKDLNERLKEMHQRALAANSNDIRRDGEELRPEALPPDFLRGPQASVEYTQTAIVSKETGTAAGGEKPEPVLWPAAPRREDLCLIVLHGKCLALPASFVLWAGDLPRRKGCRILKRGYATLRDFTPLFKRVKALVLGEWAKLPVEELESFRFEPLEARSPGRIVPSGSMAVLASDGKVHRIITCDIVNFIVDAEIVGVSCSPDSVLGPFRSKSHFPIPVFEAAGPVFGPNAA